MVLWGDMDSGSVIYARNEGGECGIDLTRAMFGKRPIEADDARRLLGCLARSIIHRSASSVPCLRPGRARPCRNFLFRNSASLPRLIHHDTTSRTRPDPPTHPPPESTHSPSPSGNKPWQHSPPRCRPPTFIPAVGNPHRPIAPIAPQTPMLIPRSTTLLTCALPPAVTRSMISPDSHVNSRFGIIVSCRVPSPPVSLYSTLSSFPRFGTSGTPHSSGPTSFIRR
ncbi:hypothetical protein BC826DRAFT_275448 [Russula brevipes]|nr:hypothetical protein BC826DRAFT_275448 [Russula brevipes]